MWQLWSAQYFSMLYFKYLIRTYTVTMITAQLGKDEKLFGNLPATDTIAEIVFRIVKIAFIKDITWETV